MRAALAMLPRYAAIIDIHDGMMRLRVTARAASRRVTLRTYARSG